MVDLELYCFFIFLYCFSYLFFKKICSFVGTDDAHFFLHNKFILIHLKNFLKTLG